ncbi:hypothetical protein B0T14DRAFT_561923 [Immersiella caudata]|uniref:N-acetyltransferase domain-containing protein n=1 Tax=Immersiella caudata TaxID=314043 RepID=A0AA40C5A3_9PEZI|nr:hypothetical protein B0T14DRAFT_561923 [Immersiella caudata]
MASPEIKLRFATLEDTETIASVVAEAMSSVEVIRFIYEGRAEEYPEDHMDRWVHRIRSHILDPNEAVVVAERTFNLSGDGSSSLHGIVAVSIWTLKGPCVGIREAMVESRRKIGWVAPLWHAIYTRYRNWGLWFSPLKDANEKRRATWLKLYERLVEKYYKPLPEYYHLEILCTAEESRRTGTAKKMVEMFLDQAKPGRIPVGLESSGMAVPFYERLGFRRVDELTLADPEDPDGDKVSLPLYFYHYD